MKIYPLVERYVRNEKTDSQPSTRAQTIRKLCCVLENLESAHGVRIGEASVDGLSGLVMSDWKGTMCRTHKPASVNCYIAMLRPFLRWLHTSGLTEQDCGAGLSFLRLPDADELPPEQRPKDKYLTHDQAKSLLECRGGYNHTRDRAIIALILYTGLRTEEVSSLNVGAFRGANVRHGTIQVRRKGGHYKDVFVPEECYGYIDAYLKTRDDPGEDEPLFITSHGNRCSTNALYRAISGKQKAVGDIATGGHALRHTFVSEIEKIGGVGIARDLANHKSIHMTNRYTHTTAEQRRSAIEALAW